jgi:hypothetical protein
MPIPRRSCHGFGLILVLDLKSVKLNVSVDGKFFDGSSMSPVNSSQQVDFQPINDATTGSQAAILLTRKQANLDVSD